MRRLAMAMAIGAGLFAAAASAQMMGHGPGMMGQGYALGRNMTAPPGGLGTSAGTMGFGCYRLLDLSEAQRASIAAIQQDLWQDHWNLMAQLRELHHGGGTPADYELMLAIREEMLEAAEEARARIEAVLTPEQRERLRGGCRP